MGRRLSWRENVYEVASTLLTCSIAGLCMGRITRWFDAKKGLMIGLRQAPLSLLGGRLVTNPLSTKQGEHLGALAQTEKLNEQVVYAYLRELPNPADRLRNMVCGTLLFTLISPACWVGLGLKAAAPMLSTSRKLALRFHLATGLLFPVGTRLICWSLDKARVCKWHRAYGMREAFTRPRSSHPAVDARLSVDGLRSIPELPEINRSLGSDPAALITAFREMITGHKGLVAHSITAKMTTAQMQAKTLIGQEFFIVMANVRAELAKLTPADQRHQLIQLNEAFSNCASQWLPVATKVYVALASGQSAVAQQVAWRNQEIKERILKSWARFLPGIDDVHLHGLVRTALSEPLGLFLPAGEDAEALFNQANPTDERLMRYLSRAIHLDRASIDRDQGAWVATFLREYTPAMLVAEHKEYWEGEHRNMLFDQLKELVRERLTQLGFKGDLKTAAERVVQGPFHNDNFEFNDAAILFLLKRTGVFEDDGVIVDGVTNQALLTQLYQ